ncbi:MAG: type IV pilus secretin PilQ [Bdellovibrionaceae bacterium]|nr:type IV pilus secretin PilQ [Pseudobdellovibrionaceae bacterium]
MLQICAKFILLGMMLFASSCSLFQKTKTRQAVSVNDLLQEDIENSSKASIGSANSFEDVDNGELSLEDDSVAEGNTSTSQDGDELSLEDDLVAEGNTSASQGNDELSLEDDFKTQEEERTTKAPVASFDAKEEENIKEHTSLKTTDLQGITYKQEGNLEIVSIKGEGKIDYVTRINKKNNQLIVQIKNAILPEKLKRPYFMKDFTGGSVVAVNSYQNSPADTANIVLQLRNGVKLKPQIINIGSMLEIRYPLRATQIAQNKNTIKGKLGSSPDQKKGTLVDFFLGGGSYYGHSISLQFEDIPVRQVVAYIATEVGANILVDDTVNGKISLKLRNIPWDQALALVLKSKGLGYIQEKGGVLRISSLENLKKEEEALVAIIKSKQSLTPLSVKVLPISFAKASELAAKLKVFLTPKRGKLSSDTRSNTLIATDVPEVLKKITLLVKNLDRAPKQVSIEAKFIEANQSFSKNLGVNWSFSGGRVDINGLQGANGPISVGLGSGGIRPVPPSSLRGLAGSVGLTLGSFKFLGDLSSILAIAEQDQVVKVISTPTVVVLDKQKASITNKGENLSISRTEQDGTITESVTRTPIKLQLDVSPQIAADGSILLDVNILREFAGGAISTGNNAKPINSRSVKSKVLIKNGDTLVIGGIFQKDTSKGNSGVPFLSKLPFFGWMFKYQSEEESKNELMVFLTPKIL